MFALVVLAGGKGSRLKKIIKNKSKTLIKIQNKTLLENIISQFRLINKKYFLINQKQKDLIYFFKKKNYLKDVFFENQPLGDGGCLSLLKNIKDYKKINFLVVAGDLLINADIKPFLNFHLKKKSKLSFWCHPTDHALDSDLVSYDRHNKVVKLHSKPHTKKNLGSISLSGIYIIHGSLLDLIPKKVLGYSSRSFFKKILNKHPNAYCYNSRDFIKDAGTKKRLFNFRKLIKTKTFEKSRQNIKVPAIFLDRDGVLNKEHANELYSNPLDLFPGTVKALRIINKSIYLAIIVTNQPAIAKGFLTRSKLTDLHNRLSFYLSCEGCYLDRIYFCPHHPKQGFAGEVKKLKINCSCRKPKIGMIKNAVKDLNIDLGKSIFIGNSLADYKCAIKSSVKYLHIGNKDIPRIHTKQFDSLLAAVKSLKI